MNLKELEEATALAGQLEELRGAIEALPGDAEIAAHLDENTTALRIVIHLGDGGGVSAPVGAADRSLIVDMLRKSLAQLDNDLVTLLAGFGVNAEQQVLQTGTEAQGATLH